MEKLKGLVFWVLFIAYEELLYSYLVFGELSENFLWIILFSLPTSIFLSTVTTLFKPIINKIITYILGIFIMIIVSAQLIYFKIFEAIISFFSFMNGGQVTDFIGTILEKMRENWLGLVLIFLPLVILILLSIFKKLECKRQNIKVALVKIGAIILSYSISIILLNTINTNAFYSNKNLYYNIHVPKITASRLGIFTMMRLDLQRYILGFEDKLSVQVSALPEEAIKEEIKYNITEIDFDTLIQQETNSTIIDMHNYFANQMPTEQNEYTGMFEGKNLIVFVAEAFSSMAIREDTTPTLYKLYEEGFQFDNFYTPVFPISTADGEYVTDTSLIPKEGVWSIYRIKGNYMPYSYANAFENLGYSSHSYHNHTSTYYHRDEYLETMGYDSYLAVGNGLEDRMNCHLWPNSDYEMIDVTVDDYINDEHFVAYYMTVSGHLAYNRSGNCMADRNWDKVENLEYSHNAKAYLATQIELDKAIEELINELEKAGKLEDTVILISGDHYPYGLTLDEINELSTYERDNIFEKYNMPLLIWNASMEEPVKVERLGSSLDILPTVLNLFGIEYDSRLLIGTDILSNSEPLIIFQDRSFITDKGRYNAVTGEFIANEGLEIEEGYVEKINSIIYQKYKMSALILDNNYYNILFKEM